MYKIAILCIIHFIFSTFVPNAIPAADTLTPARATPRKHASGQKSSKAPMNVVGKILESGWQPGRGTDLSMAIESCRRATSTSPYSADAHCALGKALSIAGYAQSALLSLTVALRLNPDHPEALYERALLCMRIRMHGQAAKDLGRLIEVRPGVADFHYQRARALLELGKIREAFRHFLKAHEIDKKYPKPTLHEEIGKIVTKVAMRTSDCTADLTMQHT
jgi:Flp pilus assembly protein TadD